MKTSDLILQQLEAKPGQTGRELAQRLAIDKGLVNSELYRMKANGKIYQNAGYRWFPGVQQKTKADGAEAPEVDTPLSRLCRYYLQCLSLDDQGGFSIFAKSRYTPEYVELPEFPGIGGSSHPLGTFPGVADLLRNMRKDTTRRAPFVGYPVRLRKMVSKKGWEGFMVEPVLMFELDEQGFRQGADPDLTAEPPILNAKVLAKFVMGSEHALMEESARIAEELGLTGTEMPELDDLMLRMKGEVCQEWDWIENPDPSRLSVGAALGDINKEGIYNRAIVFGCERSPFTKGLEQELVKLQNQSDQQIQKTALWAWLKGDFTQFQAPDALPGVLLEPLPLNSEQREAVEKALTRPLTVITGPPGTGKSQVVSSILINAAHRGRTVLFASKNNKAVDVVEARVNALGPRPVLLRLGRGEFQATLLQYMTGLLSGKVSDHDKFAHEEAQRDYLQVSARIQELQRRSENAIQLRNQVDKAELDLEPTRQELGKDLFHRIGSIDVQRLSGIAGTLEVLGKAAQKSSQPFFQRLFWRWLVPTRIEALRSQAEAARPALQSAEVTCPSSPWGEESVHGWIHAAAKLKARVSQVEAVTKYRSLLQTLVQGDRIEDLARELAGLNTRTADQSRRVWEAWLRLAPSRLTAQDRKNLGDFCAVLRLLTQSDEQGSSAGREVFAQYYKLYPKLMGQLPCWAVTSLSARGRVPFDPGFFDLLVIDEASQCDIASLLPLLFRAKSVVIIGDPKQLQHISAITKKRDTDLLARHGLLATHPAWGYSSNSVYDLAAPMVSEDQVMLKDHHRSHANIIAFSNQYFYSGDLRVATRYDRLNPPDRDKPSVRWIHVEGHVTRPGGGGAMNEQEAQAVVRELERIILTQGYQGSIGIVTPFRAQVNRIRDLVHAHAQSTRLLGHDLLIDTVHRFQGDECDVMLFSPVISKDSPKGAIGFLSGNGNLFNVAVTRARAALIVVGDRNAAKSEGVEYLAKFVGFIDGLKDEGNSTIALHGNVVDQGPNYPNVSRPELVSDWEKGFYGELYREGLRPIPQYDVEKYILDFALIHGERRLNIEVDGERYHRAWNGELLRRDQLRNMRMIELGWDVMRFWVYELRDDMPGCIARVKCWAKNDLDSAQ